MAQSITVTSGKGGVGKTSIAVNLALVLRRLGHRVTLLDADFGLANSHILLGRKSAHRLKDVIKGDAPISDAVETSDHGIKLIAGGSGELSMLDLDASQRHQLIRNLDTLADDTDYLVVDTPAGAADNTLAFVAAADRVLLVVVGEPTSFMDAYTVIKAANLERGVQAFSVLINMAKNAEEARQHFEKFRAITLRFLDVDLSYAGHVPLSMPMRRAVVEREPLLANLTDANATEARAFRNIAQKLLQSPASPRSGVRMFSDEPVEKAI